MLALALKVIDVMHPAQSTAADAQENWRSSATAIWTSLHQHLIGRYKAMQDRLTSAYFDLRSAHFVTVCD